MDISDLIYRLKCNEESAFKELVFSYSRRLMTVARLYTGTNEDAKDILQDAFILVFRKIDKFQGHEEKAFVGWIRRMIINLSLSRNQRKFRTMESSLDAMIFDVGVKADVLAKISHQELMDMIFSLPEGYRQIFGLYAIEGYSHKEIAKLLDIGESSSRSQYSRARKMLQAKFGNQIKEMIA